ncbi:MAG: GrpB family protein [Verrucomicrobia bacterium]|nr:GrpB family protein [Verrucomicrobiota bacterium]
MPILGPALTNILSDHLSGKPIDRGSWQNLHDRDRIQLSEAIVAARSGTGNEVRICSYDTQWPYMFARIEQELRSQVGALAVAIEHVGSTAVPGLAAKPIIDIEIVIASAYQFPPVKERLEKFGYIHRGPCGVPDREVFRCVIDLPVHHLYVCETDARPLREHLRFRNALRQDPELAAEYAALKRALADRYRDDRDGYTEAKTGFIRSVIETLPVKSD